MPTPRLLITLPVYNEALVLEPNVKTVHDWCTEHCQNFDWQIIIANNGSTDGTLALAEKIATALPDIAVFHTDEQGRGQALRRAWTALDADFYVYMDVDLAVDLAALPPLLNSLINGEADIVIGSRFEPEATVRRSMNRELTSRVYNQLVKLIMRLPIKDAQCGFKGINRAIATTILPKTGDNSWFWDTELLTIAHFHEFRIQEIPVNWNETRTAGRKSKVAVINTSLNYIKNLIKLRKKLSTTSKAGGGVS